MSREKPSQVVKPRKGAKKKTHSRRQHQFKAFSQRIANLKIDPIRRARRSVVEGETSYFQQALARWRDENLSENFHNFVREVAPLAESLPMIVHHEDKLVDVLVTYIEKRDTHSLEPLFDLVTHLAHDLETRFEKHFQRVVSLVMQVAAKHHDAEAIEWAFTSVAWLFVFLSRLLVSDLRPLYQLMAPYLGKSAQKPFVVRFSAEAMTFLLRKAAKSQRNDVKPLDTIMAYILEDLHNTSTEGSVDLYQQGIMTLLTDAINGVQDTLHSTAERLFASLSDQGLRVLYEAPDDQTIVQVLVGTLISVIHHTTSQTFRPILNLVLGLGHLDHTSKLSKDFNRLLFTAVTTRKGSRINQWKEVLDSIEMMVDGLNDDHTDLHSSDRSDVLYTFAAALTYAPLNELIPYLRLLDVVSQGQWTEDFLLFSNLVAELSPDRFRSLLLPSFQRFILSYWQQNAPRLCLMLPKMSRNGLFVRGAVSCPSEWQDQMLQNFESAAGGRHGRETTSLTCSALSGQLAVLQVLSNKQDVLGKVKGALTRLLISALESRPDPADLWNVFALGKGFQFACHGPDAAEIPPDLWPALCSASKEFQGLESFWKAMHSFLENHRLSLDLDGDHMGLLMTSLTACLAAPAHEIRMASLEMFIQLYTITGQVVPKPLEAALIIESTPLSLDSGRALSMRIRRLVSGYLNDDLDLWMKKAVPAYCFGLLHMRFEPIREEASNAISEICETTHGEEMVANTISLWLQGPVDVESSPAPPEHEEPPTIRHIASDFECSNVEAVRQSIVKLQAEFADTDASLNRIFANEHRIIPFATPNDRNQALQVLNKIPKVAEKRSRLLVPILLRWAGDTSTGQDDQDHDDQRWSRKDQKAMLSVFAQFQNPKVLYKSAEVYRALLSLLANGDIEIQRSALKAILAWKLPGVSRHQENLMNILDDARFREEISVFLQAGSEDDAIRQDDREGLMPVLLRLLYGKIIARGGSASQGRGQEMRRKAVFAALARFPEQDLGQFLDILAGPLSNVATFKSGHPDKYILDKVDASPRKQYGTLNMLNDMLDTLGSQLQPFATKLLDIVILCLINAARRLNEGTDVEQESSSTVANLSLYQSIRKVGIQCTHQLFAACEIPQTLEHVRTLVDEIVEPRLEKLAIESAQSVSGTLRLISVWSASNVTATFLAAKYPAVLGKAAEGLGVESAKETVKLFILNEILGNLLRLPSGDDTGEAKSLLQQYASTYLVQIDGILRNPSSRKLLDACVLAASQLAPFARGAAGKDLIDICVHLLQQPPKIVSPKTKLGLLKILHQFIPQYDLRNDDSLFHAICSLFAYFRDRESRHLLCTILEQIAYSEGMQEVAALCEDLNSFAASKVDEPDFGRRSQAFSSINDGKYLGFDPQQWRPLIYNMLYFIRDNEELAIRASASYGLRRFVDSSAIAGDKTLWVPLLNVLLAALRKGMGESSELVRSEYLAVLAHLVEHMPDWAPTKDMHVLLVKDNEEASFFSNILHIQQHRRLRSLRRLAAASEDISSANTTGFFIPLLEHFVFDTPEESNDPGSHNLAAEAVRTIGSLSASLGWSQYCMLLRKQIDNIKSRPEQHRIVLRLIGAIIDALSKAKQPSHNEIDIPRTDHGERPNGDADTDVANGDSKPIISGRKLADSLPAEDKFSSEITKHVLPPLSEFLHLKEESTVNLRVPVAIAIVKLLRLLPPNDMAARLPAVLMDISQILRSRAQDDRDMTRKTLAEISALIGPAYFGFVLKELQSALQRGYQRHVLSYTLHSIFVANQPLIKPGDLDYCLPGIVACLMDDILGAAGQEKDAEEYISRMKEVRSKTVSYDSMEILARVTTLKHLYELIRPIRALMMESLDAKTVKKIDELLRRIGLGVSQNEAVNSREILVFCYEIIQQVYAATATSAPAAKVDDYKIKRYLIQMKSANKSGNRGTTSPCVYKLARFSLDLVRLVLHRHPDLQTPANLAGLLPAVGDALVSGHEEVQLSAVRLLTAVIKVPMMHIEKNIATYAAEAVRLVSSADGTKTELAQAALKLTSAILRERRSFEFKDKDIGELIKRVKPDLDEPDRQGVAFNFLKAVMGRKIAVPEVYETADRVREIMITNHSRTARDLARAVYFQFLMEYPQGKKRWEQQKDFMMRYLAYEHMEGRQSVLEMLHVLLSKASDDVLQEMLGTLFGHLVKRLHYDESQECREMIGALVKKIFEKADADRSKDLMLSFRTWFERDDKPLLQRLSLQCWAMYMEVKELQKTQVDYLKGQLEQLLLRCVGDEDAEEWELLYFALRAFAQLSTGSGAAAFDSSTSQLWSLVRRSLLFPHQWVKQEAARLIGLLFADLASYNAQKPDGLGSLPLVGSAGLPLTDDDMHQLCYSSIRILSFPDVSEGLAAQTVRNLVFLGRCFAANNMTWQQAANPETLEEEVILNSKEDDREGEEPVTASRTALQYLFGRLTTILRKEPTSTRASALYGKTASLQIVAALSSQLPAEALIPSLETVLLPLHNLTDPSIPQPALADTAFREAYNALVSTSREIMTLIQEKVGSQAYIKALQRVREGVKGRREERRSKRAIERVSAPEAWAKDKKRKFEAKRRKRVEKGMEARGRRRGW
ncbi:U3 snoRNP protein [Elasticomyces elasticus]|nr:U3 snoRNP protein [Elasticomyces elasticus]